LGNTRVSPNLTDSEYAAQKEIENLRITNAVVFNESLHLSVSMRSFRSEKLSKLVKEILDINSNAKNTFEQLLDKYPIVLTRDLQKQKNGLVRKQEEVKGMV